MTVKKKYPQAYMIWHMTVKKLIKNDKVGSYTEKIDLIGYINFNIILNLGRTISHLLTALLR